MAVTVYFAGAGEPHSAGVDPFNKGTIPDGVGFDTVQDFPDQIRVVDDRGKVVAIVSASAMLMIEIDADADDARKGPDGAAAPTA